MSWSLRPCFARSVVRVAWLTISVPRKKRVNLLRTSNCFSNLLLVARRDTCLGVDLTLYSMLFLLLPLSFKAELLIYTLCIGCEKVLNCIQKEIVFLLNQLVMCIARYLLPNRRE